MKRITRGLIVACAFGLFTGSRAMGGISVEDDVRTVSISGEAIVFGMPAIDGPSYSQSASATPLAPFTASFKNSSTAGTATAESFASQTSSFQLTPQELIFTASGTAGYASPNAQTNTSTLSSYAFNFTLDSPATVTLTEDVEQPEFDNSFDNTGAELAAVGAVQNIFPTKPISNQAAGQQTFSDTLAAGQYSFEGSLFGDSTDDGGRGTFSVQLDVSEAATGGGSGSVGGGTTAVPLPAAFGPALIGIAGIGLGLASRRRLKQVIS